MSKWQADYPPVPCFLHFVAYGGTLGEPADMMKPSKNSHDRERKMKIAKNMEAIFLAALLVLGGINMATIVATSAIPELPFVLAAANL